MEYDLQEQLEGFYNEDESLHLSFEDLEYFSIQQEEY